MFKTEFYVEPYSNKKSTNLFYALGGVKKPKKKIAHINKSKIRLPKMKSMYSLQNNKGFKSIKTKIGSGRKGKKGKTKKGKTKKGKTKKGKTKKGKTKKGKTKKGKTKKKKIPLEIKYYSGSETYSWLSAFNIAEPFLFDGLEYPSVENCYHAQKIDPKNPNAQIWKKKFTDKGLSGLQAKKKGGPSKLKFKTEKSDPRTMYFIRDDWDDVNVEIMKDITKEYYLANPKLMKKLIDTGDTILIHTGPRIDTYWGVNVEGKGENMHGHILMELREEFKNMK